MTDDRLQAAIDELREWLARYGNGGVPGLLWPILEEILAADAEMRVSGDADR